jgi:hypothetical protein
MHVGENSVMVMFIVFNYCSQKERVHVSICSTIYLYNYVAFVGSGYEVKHQNDVL